MLAINASYMPGGLSNTTGMNKIGSVQDKGIILLRKCNLDRIIFLKKMAVRANCASKPVFQTLKQAR